MQSGKPLPQLVTGELATAAFQSAPEALIVVDARGAIHEINAAAVALFHGGDDDLHGRSVSLLLTEPWAQLVAAVDREDGRGLVDIGREVTALRRDGSTFATHVRIATLPMSDERRMFLVALRDIAARSEGGRGRLATASHDTLTGCLNRWAFIDRLDEQLTLASYRGQAVALLFVDLDEFKEINDRYGHGVGDALLTHVVRQITATVREDDMIGRLGGDEFAVSIVLDSPVDGPAIGLALAHRIADAIRRPFTVDNVTLTASASIGLASFPRDGSRREDLFRNADIAMYAGKHSAHETRVYAFDAELQQRYDRERSALQQVRNALTHDGFVVHYQPLVDFARGELIGVEALLRMRGDDGSLIPPDAFLPISARYGLMRPLTSWVLHRACVEYATLAERMGADARLCVNIPVSALETPRLLDTVLSAVSASGLDTHHLELEITETEPVGDIALVKGNMQALRARGITFSLDDFGVGFSTFSRMRALPFTRVKLDRSFLADANDERGREVVATMARLAQLFEVDFLAEGIETEVQRDLLRDIGCSQGQGFFFGTPMNLERLSDWLTEWKMQS